ncbi:hypothetical protein [Saccharopolyspora elongata]|uniref:DUF4386 family protein n=1 Tax=Saccharopolyspora elongata TaxID=2530387 RepID=A0A4R4Y8M3_9PSEU|nr:hypothetical protein [Saccharopolyspora elongata]TDD40848.1 hypothetical protein E1288_34450 [Saccharopolyspora elongata]
MNEGHEMRWGGLAGLGALVLSIIAGILLAGAPRITESADTIAGYLLAERGVVLTAVLLYAAAIALFLWFGATLATAFRLADDRSDAPAVVLAGFALTSTIGFFGAAVFGGAVFAMTSRPALLVFAAAPYTVVTVAATVTGLALAVPLTATAVAIARTGVFPQWAAWFSGFVAVISVLSAITVLSVGGVLAPGAALTTYIPGGLTALWVLAMSSLLVREHLPTISVQKGPAVGPA